MFHFRNSTKFMFILNYEVELLSTQLPYFGIVLLVVYVNGIVFISSDTLQSSENDETFEDIFYHYLVGKLYIGLTDP